MKITTLQLRRDTKRLVEALDNNQTVTIVYRGKVKGVVYPVGQTPDRKRMKVTEHPAFGMWADRSDMRDVSKYVREIRKGRFDAL